MITKILNIMIRLISLILLTSLPLAAAPLGHLFILSGQSNMTHNVKKGFEQRVTAALGEEEVQIVHCMRSGRGIRFWVADYELPEGHPRQGLSRNSSNGEEFTRLVKAVQDSCDARSFKTVSLIWMQGESDAMRDLGVAYERSFKVLVDRLKKELGLDEMHFVIGRISDFGLYGDQADAWKRMRDTQQKLADEDPLGAWINTDDLIAEDEKKNQGDLHYKPEAALKLGARFGEAALGQLSIKKK